MFQRKCSYVLVRGRQGLVLETKVAGWQRIVSPRVSKRLLLPDTELSPDLPEFAVSISELEARGLRQSEVTFHSSNLGQSISNLGRESLLWKLYTIIEHYNQVPATQLASAWKFDANRTRYLSTLVPLRSIA
mgnify:CR=1 FL=1